MTAGAHPYRGVALAAGYNTRQARHLDGETSLSITVEAALQVMADAGIEPREIDYVAGTHGLELIYTLGLGPIRGTGPYDRGSTTIIDALNAVASGSSRVALIAGGWAGVYTERDATAPWTRPQHEFVAPFGMFTAVQFALMARWHMSRYGTTPEQLATVSAIIRNNGHDNPDAVYFGRGPFSVTDILDSRMVADPFHLLDCAMTAEGAAALLVTTADRARDLRHPPVFVLGAAQDHFGPTYQHPPAWDLVGTDPGLPAGVAGRRAARTAFAMCGLEPKDVDVAEPYDPFSFEIVRQVEAIGFCADGEGGDYVTGGHIGAGGSLPICTDGGLMSFSHPGWSQQIQRVIRGMHQLQGQCRTHQVRDAEVALCTIGGSGALYCDVLLLGSHQP